MSTPDHTSPSSASVQLLSRPTSVTATSEAVDVFYGGHPLSMFVRVETAAERFHRLSNEYADAAVGWGEGGRAITADAYAHIADLYAVLANQQSALETV